MNPAYTRFGIAIDGVAITDARTLPPGCPDWVADYGDQLATVFDSVCGSQWIKVTVEWAPGPCNVGGFAVIVEVGHPDCEESAASLTLYAYEFPAARKRIRAFIRAVIVGGAE